VANKNGKHVVSAAEYATAADFKKIFIEDINSLYLLALLLTGDSKGAEKCFIESIGESIRGNHVFKEWARSWARRSVIQNAIRSISPREHRMTATRIGSVEQVLDKVPMALHPEVCAILELDPLERFVFVMSVLERFSDHECSILLGCPQRDIATLRSRAMQRLAVLLDLQQNSGVIAGKEPVIELVIAQHFATPEWNRTLSN